jgi:hypothetical protein
LEFGAGKHVNIFNVVMFGVSKFGIAIPSLSVEPVFINSENKLCNKKYSNTNEKNQQIFKDSKQLFFNVGVHDKKNDKTFEKDYQFLIKLNEKKIIFIFV